MTLHTVSAEDCWKDLCQETKEAFQNHPNDGFVELKGTPRMSIWTTWFAPKPSYFDRVTNIVNDIVELECQLRDDENAAHDRLHEIAAARRELAVRVRRA